MTDIRIIVPAAAAPSVVFDDYSDLPGNVVNFGADPTGVADSTVAIQEAFNSSNALFFPAGNYRLSQSIQIYNAQCVHCQTNRMHTGYITRANPYRTRIAARLGEQVRFMVEHTNPVFVVSGSEIDWWGGYVDVQGVTTYSDSVFKIIPQATNYGNRIAEVGLMGHKYVMADSTNTGATMFEFAFSETVSDAKLEIFHLDSIEATGIDTAFRADALTGTQLSRSHEFYQFESNDLKRHMFDNSSRDSRFWIYHQGGNTFPTSALANVTPTLFLEGVGNYFPYLWQGDYDTDRLGGTPKPGENSRTFQFTNRTHIEEFNNTEEGYHKGLALPDAHSAMLNQFAVLPFTSPMDFNTQRAALILPNVTSTTILDATSALNVFGKFAGSKVYNTTGNDAVYVATGSSPTASWVRMDGTSPLTPS